METRDCVTWKTYPYNITYCLSRPLPVFNVPRGVVWGSGRGYSMYVLYGIRMCVHCIAYYIASASARGLRALRARARGVVLKL